MLDPKSLDDVARRVTESLPAGLGPFAEDVRRNLRAAVAAALARMDLVTREELEVQAALLARTREKLDRLEAEVARIEAGRLAAAAPPETGSGP